MSIITGSHQSIEFSGVEVVNPKPIVGTPLIVRSLYANMNRFINGKPIESFLPEEIQNNEDLKNKFVMSVENCLLLQSIIREHARIIVVNNDMNRTPKGVLVAKEYVLSSTNHEILARVNEKALELLQASSTGSITLLGVSENACDHLQRMICDLEQDERIAQRRAKELAQKRAREAESERRIQAYRQRAAENIEREVNKTSHVYPIKKATKVSKTSEETCNCFSWITKLFSRRDSHYETLNG